MATEIFDPRTDGVDEVYTPLEPDPAFVKQAEPAGLISPGNIDLHNRPVVKNNDGTISTVKSVSFGIGDENSPGDTVLIPTVMDDGRIVSPEEAFKEFQRTGKHLGIFASHDEADAYGSSLSKEQGIEYGDKPSRRAQGNNIDFAPPEDKEVPGRPVTYFSRSRRNGGPDELYDYWTDHGWTKTGQNQTYGTVAVGDLKDLGNVYKDARTKEVFIATDWHGNPNKDVIDIYIPWQDHETYKKAVNSSRTRPLELVGKIPQGEIARDVEGFQKQLASFSDAEPLSFDFEEGDIEDSEGGEQTKIGHAMNVFAQTWVEGYGGGIQGLGQMVDEGLSLFDKDTDMTGYELMEKAIQLEAQIQELHEREDNSGRLVELVNQQQNIYDTVNKLQAESALDKFRSFGQGIKAYAHSFQTNPEYDDSFLLTTLPKVFGNAANTIIPFMIPYVGRTVVGPANIAGQVFEDSYNRLRDEKGMSKPEAFIRAIGNVGVQAGLEGLGFGFIRQAVKALGAEGRTLLARGVGALLNIGKEGATESAQQIASDVIESTGAEWSKGIPIDFKEVALQGIYGAIGAGPFVAGGAAVQGAIAYNRGARNPRPVAEIEQAEVENLNAGEKPDIVEVAEPETQVPQPQRRGLASAVDTGEEVDLDQQTTQEPVLTEEEKYGPKQDEVTPTQEDVVERKESSRPQSADILNQFYSEESSSPRGWESVEGMEMPAIDDNSIAKLKKQANELTKGWKNGPKVKIYKTFDDIDIPSVKRDAAKFSNGVRGFYNTETNTIGVVAENIFGDFDLKRIILHEGVGHYGVGGLLRGKDLREYNQIVDGVFNRIPKNVINDISSKYQFDLNNRQGKARLVEEYLARQAEKDPSQNWFQAVVAKIRNLLRKVIPGMEFTDGDIVDLIKQGAKRLEQNSVPETVRVRELDGRGNIVEAQEKPTTELRRQLSLLAGKYKLLMNCLELA